jgi:hypothetical protein
MAAKILTPSMLPGVMQVAKCSFGAKATDNPDVLWPATDISIGTVLFRAPKGTFIKDVTMHIKTAFGSTGAFVMDIGDGTDADGFIESTDLVASDAKIYSSAFRQVGSTGALNSYALGDGKLTTSDSTLDTDNLENAVVATVGAHPLNAGLADFYVTYFSTLEITAP